VTFPRSYTDRARALLKPRIQLTRKPQADPPPVGADLFVRLKWTAELEVVRHPASHPRGSMRSIDRVVKDGFILSAPHQELSDRALLSSGIALRAYFSTFVK